MRKNNVVNLFALATIQFSNAVLPLIVFPLTLNRVGSDLYSKVVLSEAIALFALPFVLYSFDIDGVSRIVGMDIREDIRKISQVFSEVLCFRMCLFAVCLVLLSLFGPLLERKILMLVYCWMLIPLSHILQSFWLFQGLERNAPIAVFIFLSRLACVLLVLLLVREPGDFFLVPLIIGGCYVSGGFLSLVYATAKYGLRFRYPSLRELRESIRGGKEIFLGNLSVMLFRDVNVLILGVLHADGRAIAAYSIAEKLTKSIQATMRPLNQLFFPKVVRLTRDFTKPCRTVFRKILRLTLPQVAALLALGVVLAAGFLFLGDRVAFLRNFENRGEVVLLLIIMFPAVLFGIANFMFGSAGLNHLNGKGYFFGSILAVGVFSVSLCFVLVSAIGARGASWSFLFSEMFLFVLIAGKYRLNC